MKQSLFPRKDYPSLNKAIYLNQASLGLVGQPAVKAMHAFLDDVARHGNLNMSDSDEVAYFQTLRERGAQLLHCDPSQVAILSGASELLGQLPLLLAPENGRKIVMVSSDFPAITRPWLRYAALHDCSIHFVDDDSAHSLTDLLIEAIDAETAVLAVSQVQFATGTIVDIPRLRQATSAVGATLVVDATQAAGAMRVDTTAWEADVVVSSGYKWLGGHGGVALGVLSKELLEKMPPLPGWMGAPDPFHFEATQLLLADDARRYTQSTMSYISLAGLTAALEERLAFDEAVIEMHACQLASHLLEKVEPLGWCPFRPLESQSAAAHIVSLAHPSLSVEAAVAALRANGVVCGSRNGRIRVSIAPYNHEADINEFAAILANI